jgi:uncharacterized protein (DUF1015 family)
MQPTRRPGGFEIAPLRGLRYDLARACPEALTSPPYDVISPEDHVRLLRAAPHNITRITLGAEPGAASSYAERGDLLREWVRQGILVLDDAPGFYAYLIDYPVPGSSPGAGGALRRAHFVGLLALGRLHPFAEGIVLPHERTFPKVVEDRLNLLDATRTQLESIFLLYSDPEREVERLIESQCRGEPVIRVEARPGEHHELHRITDVAAFIRLTDFFGTQRPIIADGHHRYTTSLRFLEERARHVPGAGWQLMTLANLHSDGLSILATHRLVKLRGETRGVLDGLLGRLEVTAGPDRDLTIETRERQVGVRFPAALRAAKKGVARTSYALVQDVVLGEWLRDVAGEESIRYYKEATGENEALARGEGDLLFRMRPVDRGEFQEVVQGGEVFPHKTTYFYPKLWSGLVLWPLAEPERLALK